MSTDALGNPDTSTTEETREQSKSSERVMSIDALRGFDMFWIIGGGTVFASLHKIFGCPTTEFIKTQLSHVEWEGFRFEDLIMPLFMFIVGVVMPYSFQKRIDRGDKRGKLYVHIVRRTVILFILGMIAQGDLLAYDLAVLDIYCNTLQAIAAGYLIGSLVYLNLKVVGQVIVTAGLLLLFWGVMMLVPVPGHGAGQLTEDGNLAIWLDHLILGDFQDGTTYTWILSSMVFACTVMLGIFAGQVLRLKIGGLKKVLLLIVFGAVSLGLGMAWNIWFPIIKHLWTSSFVLYSAGICFLLLALFYLVIDVIGLKKWAFVFVVVGSNAIAVYMATHLFDFRKWADIFLGPLYKHVGNWDDLVRATGGLIIVWLILLWMYRKKSFIKI